MQPKTIQRLTVWTIIANMAIITGNGYLFMILAEVIAPFHLIETPLVFSLNNFYEELIPAGAMFSAIAQSLLAISLLLPITPRIFLTALGLLSGYAGIFFLSFNLGRDSDALYSLLGAIPFVTLSIILIYKLVTQNIRQLSAIEEFEPMEI